MPSPSQFLVLVLLLSVLVRSKHDEVGRPGQAAFRAPDLLLPSGPSFLMCELRCVEPCRTHFWATRMLVICTIV